MSERERPEEETEERRPAGPGEEVDPGRSPGGVDPVTGEEGSEESQNADIPAA